MKDVLKDVLPVALLVLLMRFVLLSPVPPSPQSMVDMGNKRARRLYEAHLPENFRRPQTDQYPRTVFCLTVYLLASALIQTHFFLFLSLHSCI